MTQSCDVNIPQPPRHAWLDRRRWVQAYNHFPVKHAWDALALGKQMLRTDVDWKTRAAILRFYADAGGIDNLIVTQPRTGSHWSILGISLALNLKEGGAGDYRHAHPRDLWLPDGGFRYTKLDWRIPTDDWLDIHPVRPNPVIYHSHHPYYRLRTARLKRMRIVVVIRDIMDGLTSNFFRRCKTPDAPTAEDDANVPWDELIDEAIEFHNSWGEAVHWHPGLKVFRYDELMADRDAQFKRMTDHWGMEIPEETIREAFDRITKEKMKVKLEEAGIPKQTRVSYRAKESAMPQHRIEMIKERIERELVYDFGYSYD